MQEEILSKRVMYFLNDKLYLHCPHKTMYEDCNEPLNWQPSGAAMGTADRVRDFQNLIEDYSKRILTKEDDAFRAISGMLGRISRTQQWQIIAGMPTIGLGSMMLFRKRDHILRQRVGFPSYSWLGWEGAVDFKEGKSFIRDAWIVYYVWKPSNDALSIDHRHADLEVNADTIEYLAASGSVCQLEPELRMLSGTDSDRKVPWGGAWERPLRPFPLLRFWTLATFFKLENVDYVKGTAQIQRPAGSKIHFRSFGEVTLDGLDDCPLPDPGQFIFLNMTTLSNGEYTILLIDWIDGVAERRGIGHIDSYAIQDSLSPGPIWKEIVLG